MIIRKCRKRKIKKSKKTSASKERQTDRQKTNFVGRRIMAVQREPRPLVESLSLYSEGEELRYFNNTAGFCQQLCMKNRRKKKHTHISPI